MREVRLTGRDVGDRVALVDDEDYERVVAAGPWYVRSHGYTNYALSGKVSWQMHSFIMDGVGVDHINGDGLDNRRSNLRFANQSQNMANQRLRSDNTSGYKGVTGPRGKAGVWMAQIYHRGRNKNLGYYATAEAAARVYDAAARETFGEFARPNFPDGA